MSSKRRGSYIVTQLDSINLRLTNLFDEIGLNTTEREDRERKVYSVISDALESYVTEIKAEREEVKAKCLNTRKQVQSMMKSLKDVDMTLLLGPKLREILLPRDEDMDSEDYIPQPYLETLNSLNVAFNQIQNIYVERSNLANKLFGDLAELSEKLKGIEISPELSPPSTGSSKDDIEINLSTHYLSQLENEVQRWRNELQSRISKISLASVQIVNLYAELGTPQTEIDGSIMSHYKDSPELIGTGKLDLERVERTLQNLLDEKQQREEKIANLSEQVFKLWKKLGEDETYINNFEKSNRGLGLNVLHAYEKEHERLMEKKRQHIGVFIQDARSTLEDLWDKLYFSEEETLQFTPAWSDVVTDASLEAHEAEIARLEKLLEERQPIIQLIDQYKELQNEEQELQSSTQDASRLLQRGRRDPTRLLREEQMRKRIAKRKPRVMQELKAGLDEWEKRNGKPFYINGEDFSKILEQELAKSASSRKVPSRLGISASSKPAPAPAPASSAPPSRGPMRTVSSATTTSSRFAAPTPRSFSRAGPTTNSTISRAQNNRSPTRPLANTPMTRSTPLSSNLLKPHPRLSPTKTNAVPASRTISSQLNSSQAPASSTRTPAMLPRARTALGTHSQLRAPSSTSSRLDMRLNNGRAGNESPVRQDRITSQTNGSLLSNNRTLMRPGTSLGLRTPPTTNLPSSLQRSPEQSPLRRPISLLAPSRMVAEQSRSENIDAGNDSIMSNSFSHSRSRSELGHYPEEMSPHRRQLLLLQQQQQNHQNTLNRLSELSLGSPSSHSTMIMPIEPYPGSNTNSVIKNQTNNSLSIFGSNKENGFSMNKNNSHNDSMDYRTEAEENLSGDTVVYNKKLVNTSTPTTVHLHNGNYNNNNGHLQNQQNLLKGPCSENWQAYEDTSMDSEFDDPLYNQWRQNALQKLANGGGQSMTPVHDRKDRLSDFNWEKDTF